jgi:hypothetical protein
MSRKLAKILKIFDRDIHIMQMYYLSLIGVIIAQVFAGYLIISSWLYILQRIGDSCHIFNKGSSSLPCKAMAHTPTSHLYARIVSDANCVTGNFLQFKPAGNL